MMDEKALELLESAMGVPLTPEETFTHRKTLTVQDVAEKTSEMLRRKSPPTEAEAKTDFNSFVLDLALNRPTRELTAAHRLLLRSCPDVVPAVILDNLELPHGTVYAQAIASLCARDAAPVSTRKTETLRDEKPAA